MAGMVGLLALYFDAPLRAKIQATAAIITGRGKASTNVNSTKHKKFPPFTLSGWHQESPPVFYKKFNVAEQQFSSMFAPAGSIFSITKQGGWASESPQIRIKVYRADEQQFVAEAPTPPFVTPQGWESEHPQIKVKAYRADEQQFADLPLPPAATPQGWTSEHPQLLAKLYNAAQQQFDTYLPPPTTAPWGWQPVIYEPIVKAFLSALQQASSDINFFQQAATTPFTNWGWASESPPALVKHFLAALQQDGTAFNPQGAIFSITPQGGWASEHPQVKVKSFGVEQQQVSGFGPQGTIFSQPLTGWASESPQTTIRPFGIGQQQQLSISPSPAATTPQGWASESPLAFAKRYIAGQEAFVFTPPGAFTPYAESPLVLVRPFTVGKDQYAFVFTPTQTFAAPLEWFTENPQFRIGQFKSALLEAEATPFQGTVVAAATPQGWQPVVFDPVIHSFNAALQQFSAAPSFPYTQVTPTVQRLHNLPFLVTVGKMKSF